MNGAHFHLVINHFPIVLTLVSWIGLLVALFLNNKSIKLAAYVLFFVTGITSFLAVQSGERAEDIVEEVSGVSSEVIHEHEELAETFARFTYVTALLALVGLIRRKNRFFAHRVLPILILFLGLGSLYFSYQAGSSGGAISHLEVIQFKE
jgi:drug/metabolite transporter (DMT)-like permease